ncbi:SDR family oxidoreductase [uncultured Shewanella sp.]|uniref:SDR family oxidoreductase n=1 Tax=uncultured Shewanella sp. TaxID=173975 RepID=UPI00261EAEA5|nr:SDR family oxidoreductase [uncultured Shewanella sp.]
MNKVVIVTGASRGIGAATAVLLASQGYAVCINYRVQEQAAKQVLQTILEAGGVAIAVAADVSCEADVAELFLKAEAQLGSVTHLVNNAGILKAQSALSKMTTSRFQQVLTTNVMSCFLCCREALKFMSEGGAIVNVSSAASRLGAANEYIDYATSKGAMDSLTIGLSKEVASLGIRVNAVRPGLITTDIHADGGEPDRAQRLGQQTPLRRSGSPEEVAAAIAWLLSDEASYVTGSFIDIAGGI